MGHVTKIESTLGADVSGLISELDGVLAALTPPEFCSHMSTEDMMQDETTVFVTRDGGVAVACGALKRHGGGIGEVKRMYTRPSHQRRGIGGEILGLIEAHARAAGVTRLVLETGDRHPAAWRIYERGGFTRCGAVLDYPASDWSVFYEKSLNSQLSRDQ